MVSPGVESQQGGDISAELKRTVKEGSVQFQTSLEALICSTPRLRTLRILKLQRLCEASILKEHQLSHTSGKMSGVLCVTSYSSLPLSVRFA